MRIPLALPASAGIVSALATDVISGKVYAGTWGADGAPAMLLTLDPITMQPVGGALALRAGFAGVLAAESAVRALHVVPQSRLLIATCAGASSASTAGAAVQLRVEADGTLTRLTALAAPEIAHPISLSLLDVSSPPSAKLYLVLAAMPPVLVQADALTMQVSGRWPLKDSERQFGACIRGQRAREGARASCVHASAPWRRRVTAGGLCDRAAAYRNGRHHATNGRGAGAARRYLLRHARRQRRCGLLWHRWLARGAAQARLGALV